MKKIILVMGTGLGAGFLPLCPGTIGSLWGVMIYLGITLTISNFFFYLTITLAILLLGVWIAGKCENYLKKKDHQAIVIDEIGGFLVGMMGISFSFPALALGFIFFRLFDIVKPFHMEKLHNFPGGWGIVTDDIVAGLLTNIFLRALFSMLGW